jgi:hypothetical protein
MPRHVPFLIAFASCFTAVDSVSAQTVLRVANVRTPAAVPVVGRIQGVVRDDRGQALGDVSIVAMGSSLASVRSDARGRFLLAVSPGDYVLRATRTGYVSTFREAVRVRSSDLLERQITLIRQEAPIAIAASLLDDHAHSEAAWRLRHLPRVVLRDAARTAAIFAEPTAPKKRTSFFGWAVEESARAAASFVTETDFSGQLNFVTTSAAPTGTRWLPFGGPRGIAYVSVGAPVGTHGDWRIRATMASGTLSSWAVLGEYEASPDAIHAFSVGFSYTAQGYLSRRGGPQSIESTSTRSVGGVFAHDRWQATSRLLLEYGLRVERYDYTTPGDLASPQVGFRLRTLPRVFLRARAAQRMLAPGAEEFLPPPSAALWLPPERTFSPLTPRAPMLVARLRHRELAIEREIGPAGLATVVSLVHFAQELQNQIATLFRSGDANASGHYQIATPGTVAVDGWIVRVSGRLLRRMHGSIDYSRVSAHWTKGSQARTLGYRVPSATRQDERIHDLTASLDTVIPESSTRITVAYRFDTAYSRVRWKGAEPASGRRFAVQIHQALPYQPIRDGRLEAVFSLRTLLRDDDAIRPFYDELLTVSPPLRLMGGVQVKF